MLPNTPDPTWAIHQRVKCRHSPRLSHIQRQSLNGSRPNLRRQKAEVQPWSSPQPWDSVWQNWWWATSLLKPDILLNVKTENSENCDTNTGWLPQDSYFITFQRSCKSQKFFSTVARLGKNLLQSSWSRHRSEPPFQQPEGCQALFVLHSCFHTVYNLRPVYKDAPHTYTRKTRWWSDAEKEELPCFVVFGWTTRASFKKESCVRRFMRNWRWTENMYSWRAFDVKDEKHNVAQQLVVHWRKACKAAPNKIPTVTELPRVQVQVMCVFFVSYPITAKCQEKLIKLHLLVP